MNYVEREGFSFRFFPLKCNICNGACCRGESGYIWVSISEMRDISNMLGVEFDEFTRRFIKKVKYRYSLSEKILKKGDYGCVFFDENNLCCLIYEVRPKQCREFPFWDRYKKDCREVFEECIAVE